MEERTKQRLVGVLVFVGALFIILPFLFHNARPLSSENNSSANTASAAVALPPQNQTQTVAMNNDATTTVATSQTAPVNAGPNSDNTSTTMPAQNNAPAPTSNNPTVMPSIAPNNANPTTQPNSNQPAPGPSAVPNNNPNANPNNNGNGNPIGTPTQNNAPQPGNNSLPAAPAAQPTGLTGGQPLAAPAPATSSDTTAQNKPSAVTEHSQLTQEKPTHPVMTAEHQKRHAPIAEGWTIQIGAFSEKANAAHLISDLREHHFHVYTRELKTGDRHLTAVFVGPERSLDHVRMAQEQLRAEFRINGEIKRYEG